MKRVFILIVLLISTYVFEIVFLYPGNIADEAYYYRDTTQVSVTNTTIYKDDLQHYYKSIKTLEKTNFDNLNKKISNNQRKYLDIDKTHFDYVVDAMEKVVMNGSARRGFMKDLMLCGKTSTVQNPHGYDHSGFIGFAPKNNPKIAIAAYIENAGWGGRAAASISSLASEYYIFGKTKRNWLEDYVLKGDFIDEEN